VQLIVTDGVLAYLGLFSRPLPCVDPDAVEHRTQPRQAKLVFALRPRLLFWQGPKGFDLTVSARAARSKHEAAHDVLVRGVIAKLEGACDRRCRARPAGTQGRPQFAGRGKNVVAYTPAKTVDNVRKGLKDGGNGVVWVGDAQLI
jgi:hypothetical protein